MSNPIAPKGKEINREAMDAFMASSVVQGLRSYHNSVVNNPFLELELLEAVDIVPIASVPIPLSLIMDKTIIDRCKNGVYMASGKVAALSLRIERVKVSS